MKSFSSFLRTGVIILALAFLAMAGSCEKGGGNGNNNSGDSGGGPIGNPGLTFKITDPNSVKIVGSEIRIKNELLSRMRQADTGTTIIDNFRVFGDTINFFNSEKLKKIFEVTFTNADGSEAEGGLMFAGNGDWADVTNFRTETRTNNFTRSEEVNKILRMVLKSGSSTHYLKARLNFFSAFADPTTPKSEDAVSVGKPPFAFTRTKNYQPVFFCITAVTGITIDMVAQRLQGTETLAGGQKTGCYISYFKLTADSKPNDQNEWMATPASTGFKKAFNVAFAGIKTDKKTIADIGLPGDSLGAKISNFNYGLSESEIESIVNAGNLAKYKKMTLRIVNNGDFLADGAIPPPLEFTITPLNEDLVKVVETGGNITIKLKASAFPADPARGATDNFEVNLPNMVPAFEVAMTPATGGLVLASKGNLSLHEFTTGTSCGNGNPADNSRICTTAWHQGSGTVFDAGLNVFGNFMDKTTPRADNDIYAFTATANTSVDVQDGTQPIIVCRALVPSITRQNVEGVIVGGVQVDSVFTGGQTATCFVGSAGAMGLGTEAARNKWLGMTAGATFKKSFDIAFAGIKTENRPYNDMGWLGGDGDAMKSDFSSGIDADTMTALIANNPTTYKKVTVEVVENLPAGN